MYCRQEDYIQISDAAAIRHLEDNCSCSVPPAEYIVPCAEYIVSLTSRLRSILRRRVMQIFCGGNVAISVETSISFVCLKAKAGYYITTLTEM